MAFLSPLGSPIRGSAYRNRTANRARGRATGGQWSPVYLAPYAWYDAELGQPKGVGYVQLDGTSGDYIYTPDAINVDQTGDLELVMRVYCNDWSTGANQTLACKYITTGNQRSWRVYVSTTGQIALSASPDGTSAALATAIVTPSVALPDATWIWLRARLQLSNGASSVGTLDTAADTGSNSVLPVSWTANGLPSLAVPLAGIFSSTSPVEIGSFANGTLERLAGRVGRCIVRDGFDGRTVADFNASDCYGPGYLNQGSLPTDGGGARYVPLRGVSGDYVWTADKAALRITGDIEIVARVNADTFASGAFRFIAGRWGGSGVQSWGLFSTSSANSKPTIYWTTDGSTALNATPTTWSQAAGATFWLKVTIDVDNGASGYTVRFYTAADQTSEPTGWTQVGSDVSGVGVSSIFAGSAFLGIGNHAAGSAPFAGKIYRVIVRNGIGGTVVADFNAEQATVFGQAADGYGNGWLIADPKHLGNWTLGLPKIYDRSGNGVAPATFGAGSNQPQWLPWKGAAGVFLTPSSSNRLSTPSSAAFNTTDLDVWVDITMPDWSPSGETTIAARKDPSDPNQAWRLTVTGSGAVTLRWYPLGTGASLLSRTSAVNLSQCGVVDGQRVAIRAILDVDNGAGGYTVTMQLRHGGYDGTWVTFDSFTGGATTALPSVNRVLEFGNEGGNGDVIVHRGFLAGSIGGAAVADLVAASCGQSGYTDTLGNVWTVGRATSGRKGVVQSPVANSARSVILHGTDDWIDVPAAAVPALDTYAAASSVTASFRRWHNPGGSSLYAVFTTKASSANGTLGAAIRMGSVAGSTQLSTVTGDGTAFDFTTMDDPNSAGLGVRAVASLNIGSTSPFLVSQVNSGAAASDVGRGTTVSTSTGGAGRIGAYLSGAGAIDMEFETLILRDVGATDTEHGLVTAYYRGGL